MVTKLFKSPRNRYPVFKHLAFCLLILSSSVIYSHGKLSIRIQEKTVEISKNPNNARLYFERGFLYQQHFEYENAIEDYNKAEVLGFNNKLLYFYKAETYLANNNPKEALETSNLYFKENLKDVKIYQLKAKIFYALKEYSKSIEFYQFVLENMIDIRPDDIIEYATIILAENPSNYNKALEVIEKGLEKLGENVLTLNLKKLDYLIESNQVEKVIEQYNYFIISNKRKEFWYYKKAKYLAQLNNMNDAYISLQQSRIAISILKPKTKNTLAVKKLVIKINELENSITL